MENYLFYFFGALGIVSGLSVLITNKVIYAAFLLMLSFLGLAGVYVLASAEYVAMTQIMVYVGAVLVLMVFGLMLTSRSLGQEVLTKTYNRFWGAIIPGLFLLMLLAAISQMNLSNLSTSADENSVSNLKSLGILFITDNVLPFEVIGILLLVALIGAAFIFGTKKSSLK